MSDNTTLNTGTGGDVIATDDIAGVKHQQVKVEWGVDGTATPVSAANPMPVVQTGTVTVASHAVTNTGTFATQVDGAALTALQLIDDVVFAEDVAAQAADKGVAILAVRRDADTSLVGADNDYANLQVNAAGSLKVAITAGAGSGGTSIADGASFTRDTTSVSVAGAVVETSAPTLINGDAAGLSMTTGGALRVSVASGGIAGIADDAAFTPGTSEVLPIGFTFDDSSPDSVNEGDIGAARMSANRNQYVTIRDAAGNERGLNIDASGQVAVTVAAAQTLATVTTVGTVTTITNQGQIVDDAAFTPATTRVMMNGYFADETATDSVDEGDGGAARMTLDRKQIVNIQPHTSGGCTIFKSIDIDESEEEVKATAGVLYSITAMNMVATARFLKFYNLTAANTTVGTSTPVMTIPVPANSTTGAGFTINNPLGWTFDTAISVAATTGVADADTGAPGANDVIILLGYK